MVATIKENMPATLRKIRKGLVFDPDSVWKELFQNAFRALAKTIEIDLEADSITMIDDGVGLDNPEVLFEKSTSGWTTDVCNPYGEGLFAVFSVAEEIVIQSKDWFVHIDVEEILLDESLRYSIEKSEEFINGFKITLRGEEIRKNWTSIYTEVETLGAVCKQEVFLNKLPIAKKDLFALPKADFVYKVENSSFRGNLAPERGWEDIHVYFENRFVCECWVGGLSGVIELVNGNVVDLKAPDRKAIIQNDKYWTFMDLLKEEKEKMYRAFVVARPDLLHLYSEKIATTLKVKDYVRHLTFEEEVFNTKKLLTGIEDLFQQMTDLTSEQVERRVEKAKVEKMETIEEPQKLLDNCYSENREEEDYSHVVPLVVSEEERKEKEIEKKKMEKRKSATVLKRIKKNPQKKIFVKASEATEYKAMIAELEYYGYTVLVAQNELYACAFEEFGITSIKSVGKEIEKANKVTDVAVKNHKERRIIYLLSFIEDYYKIGDVFRIGKLELEIRTTILGKTNIEKQKVLGLCDKGKIYLDRTGLEYIERTDGSTYGYRNVEYVGLSLDDWKYIPFLLQTVSHELAHLLKNTKDNTVEHFKAENQIREELLRMFKRR